jgi:hypothetical protein
MQVLNWFKLFFDPPRLFPRAMPKAGVHSHSVRRRLSIPGKGMEDKLQRMTGIPIAG